METAGEARSIIVSLLRGYHLNDVRKATAGQLEDYCYRAGKDKTFGTHDLNYQNRKRLCYALLFQKYLQGADSKTYSSTEVNGGKSPEALESIECLKDFRGLDGLGNQEGQKGQEGLIRSLFLEELKDRQNNSFQGIGCNLEILTQLLNQYQREEDKALFSKAKEANFDCACGYDPDENGWAADIDEMTTEDLIYLALDLGEDSAAKQIIGLWKQEIENKKGEIGLTEYQTLANWEKQVCSTEERIETLQKIVQLTKESSSAWDICSAYHRLLEVQIAAEHFQQAYASLKESIPLLSEARREWWNIGLGRGFLECTVDLVLHGEHAQELWNWCLPYIQKAKENCLHGNLCRKTAEAARLQNMPELAEEMEDYYRNLMGGIHRS